MRNQIIAIQRFPNFGQRILDRIYGIPFLFRMKRLTPRITLGSFVIGGSHPIYDLPLIELRRDGRVFLAFPEKANICVGESYHIVRPIYLFGDEYFALGRPRRLVATMKIVKITGNAQAQVQVLNGSVIAGVSAERIEE